MNGCVRYRSHNQTRIEASLRERNMQRNFKWMTAASIVLAIMTAPQLRAATQNAVVYGTVYDATGGPLAGVEVSLYNSAIGFARSTITGADGSYNSVEVPPAEKY